MIDEEVQRRDATRDTVLQHAVDGPLLTAQVLWKDGAAGQD